MRSTAPATACREGRRDGRAADDLLHRGPRRDVTELKRRCGAHPARSIPSFAAPLCANKGVRHMLDAVVDYLPSPEDVPPVTGINPKTGAEEERTAEDNRAHGRPGLQDRGGRVRGPAGLRRIYSGQVKSGMAVLNTTREKQERFGRLLRMHANQREEVGEAAAATSSLLSGSRTPSPATRWPTLRSRCCSRQSSSRSR